MTTENLLKLWRRIERDQGVDPKITLEMATDYMQRWLFSVKAEALRTTAYAVLEEGEDDLGYELLDLADLRENQ